MNWKLVASAALVGIVTIAGPAAAVDVDKAVKLKDSDGVRSSCTFGVSRVTRDYRPTVRYLKVKWWVQCNNNTGNYGAKWVPRGRGDRATTLDTGLTVTDDQIQRHVTLARCNNMMDGHNWNHPFQQMKLKAQAGFHPAAGGQSSYGDMVIQLPYKC